MVNHTQNVSHNHRAHNGDVANQAKKAHGNRKSRVNKAKASQKGGTNKPLDVDAVLNAALNQQVGSLYLLADVQTSESKLSVAMRQHAVKNCADRVEMFRKLLEIQGDLCSTAAFGHFKDDIGYFPNMNLSDMIHALGNCGVPDNVFTGISNMPTSVQNEFLQNIDGWIGRCNGKLTAFQGLGGSITPELNLATANEESAKALSDNEQNGVGALGQSMTQLIAQLSAETNMFSDVVAG